MHINLENYKLAFMLKKLLDCNKHDFRVRGYLNIELQACSKG